jgi:hypothetical protein
MRLRGLGLSGLPVETPGDVVVRLVAMQSQEHAYARWSVAQRFGNGAPVAADVDAAFNRGEILRTHVLRPTWHFVSPSDLRWLMELSGHRVDGRNRRRYAGLGLDSKTLSRALDVIAESVAKEPLTRRQLGIELEDRGLSTEGQRLPHMLMHAELQSVVCSGPMRGKFHTYAAFDERVPPANGPSGDEALVVLVHRYFATRGPATLKDFVWWSGIATAEARKALAAVGSQLDSRTVDGLVYFFQDDGSAPGTGPRVHLVQCYDEMIISYTESRNLLQTPAVSFPVPRAIEGYTHVILADGRLVGHWRRVTARGTSRVETRTDQPVDRALRKALDEAVGRYEEFLAPAT